MDWTSLAGRNDEKGDVPGVFMFMNRVEEVGVVIQVGSFGLCMAAMTRSWDGRGSFQTLSRLVVKSASRVDVV